MSEAKYCEGCGILLQDENIAKEGYTTSLENTICQRCFRLKNYGEYQTVTKSNEEYLRILQSIAKTKDLVVYVVDLLNIEQDLSKIRQLLPNKMILVLNKRDLLPKSVKEEKIKAYLQEVGVSFEDIVIISATKNYQIDLLLRKIKLYQTSKQVYVVGHTNAGKSTLINQFIHDYASSLRELTISPLPSTTLNKIEIEINPHLMIIDTPGLVDRGSLVNYVDPKLLKKLSPKREIKPRTYQLRKGQALLIEDFLRLDYVEGERNSFTLYLSDALTVKRLLVAPRHDTLKDLAKQTIDLKYREDLVINGLGWIKVVNKGTVDLYLNKDITSFVRKSLI